MKSEIIAFRVVSQPEYQYFYLTNDSKIAILI